MIKEHKIPTILAFLLLTLGLVAGVFLVQQGQVFFLRAAPETTPSEIKITNLTTSSFSVSWVTQKETTGLVKFGEKGSSEQTVADDRDQLAGQAGSFLTHHVTLKNLKPKTRYFFKLGSQDRFFDNSGKPYEIVTAPALSFTPPPSDIASGKVLTPEGKGAEGAIVYLSIINMTPQSVLAGSGGTWFVSLSTAFSSSLTSFATYDRKTQSEEIFVQGAKAGSATAITTTDNDNPVPEITLGKTYDFRQKPSLETTPQPALTPSAIASPSSKFSLTEIKPPTPATESATLTITNPTKEGEKINTPKPEFQGTGPAGKTIQILVESPAYSGTIKIKNDGSWTWIPPTDLPSGEHKITITYLGKSLTRRFTVLAAGASELPAFTATPSAKLTPTPTATPSARTSMPSTQAGVPKPGNLTPTFWVFIMGLVLILSGLVIRKLLAHDR